MNAFLNASSAVLLLLGFRYIRQRKVEQHRNCMLAAVATSALFLACYLTYHIHRTYVSGLGPTRFEGQGVIRPVYFSVLLSHTILAVVNLPMVVATLTFALRNRIARHRYWARWTLPIWLYVSVTGVFVYLMLYHFYPSES